MKLAERLEWGFGRRFSRRQTGVLFALAVHRNATVNEVWDSSLGQGGWNLRFSRDSNDWELDLIGELFHMLRDFKISSEEDSVLWKGGGHGAFRIRMLIICWLLLVPSPSPKRAFGWIRFQPKLLFCLGGHVGEDPHFG
ncbi:hypothetical protein CK203_022638 [Vitis vinifera]|uniref:Uncharacterized protein n=1 Tax=Vitis vinifera TaxID=29760 RepID=A0A438JEI3_VITVI|nr:hypothetical protein CK203_022638 [Vitis vinifera]